MKIFGHFSKRVDYELEELFKQCDNIKVIKDKENCNEICIEIENKNNIIKIILGDTFPFKVPEVYVNNIRYINFLQSPSLRMSKIIDNELQLNCMCCRSILNKNLWAPSTKFTNIINEVDKNIRIKKYIYFMALINQIKIKYLIRDIDIMSYLFKNL